MFEAISFCTQDKVNTTAPIDIGALVECILFYEKTTVIANQAILSQLIKYFCVERLLVLIDEGLLNLVYTESFVLVPYIGRREGIVLLVNKLIRTGFKHFECEIG